MAMSRFADRCPTCKLTDLTYADHRVRDCIDPWHGDDHLRCGPITQDSRAEQKLEIGPETLRQAADVHNATTIRMRAETSRRCFEEALQFFVQCWAPKDREDRDHFQRDLMMLMRDAMEHKSMVYGMHIDRTESTLHRLAMVSTSSLNVIFKEKP